MDPTMPMIDHLRLMIPVSPVYTCERGKGSFYFEGDRVGLGLLDLGLTCASRQVGRDDQGNIVAKDLYAPYESLPSSFTDMAFKFYTTGRNCLPFVELKASPAKLLQGHNVYGSTSLKQGVYEMLGLLLESYPKLTQVLEVEKTELLHIDATASARLPNQNLVQPVLDFLANVGKGHRKATYKAFENYCRWGNKNASIAAKAYGKYLESQAQLKELERRALKGDARAKSCALALSKAYPFSHALLRFEARITKTYLVKNGYPSNVWELIKHQNDRPDLSKTLWEKAFMPIFESLQGEHMTFKNDYEIEQLIKSKLFSITKTGKRSYAKANHAIDFYYKLKRDGFASLHKQVLLGEYSEQVFYRNIKALTDCGISRAHLQNLHRQDNKVVPFVQMVNVHFAEQRPLDFVEPVSQYARYFERAA